MKPQRITLPRGDTRFIEFTILDVYRGTHHRDTAISGLGVFWEQGRHLTVFSVMPILPVESSASPAISAGEPA